MALKNSLFNVDKLIESRPTRGYPIMDTLSFLVYSIEYYLLIKYCYRLVQRGFELCDFLTSFIELIVFLLIAETDCPKCTRPPLDIVPNRNVPIWSILLRTFRLTFLGLLFLLFVSWLAPLRILMHGLFLLYSRLWIVGFALRFG